MHRADKAVLRLAIGLGLAVLIAYGLALPAPFVVCVMTVVLLCKPGPPIPFVKGVVMGVVIAALLVAGVLMVPVLENYAVTGVVLTGALLYAVFFAGARSANPLTIVLVIAVTVIPVAGVADQALSTALSVAFGVGLGTGVLVSGVSHAFFPDAPGPASIAAAPATVSPETASWSALQATLVVDARIRAGPDQPGLLSGGHHQNGDAGPAGRFHQRPFGRTGVGGIHAHGGMDGGTGLVRPVAAAEPVDADVVDGGCSALGRRKTVRSQATSFAPSFWSNALVTMLILLGPAIEDAAVGKDVYSASATRVALFVGVALYAWATVWALERWRASRSEALVFKRT